MVRILLCGDKTDKRFTKRLCRVLKEYGGVLYVSENKIFETHVKTDFLICDYEFLDFSNISGALLIFKPDLKNAKGRIYLHSDTVCIVGGENETALQLIKGSRTLALTCGMSLKDTVTLSSVAETGAVVSVQRELVCLGGEAVGPCEVKVTFTSRYTDYETMVICAVLLITGKIKDGKLIL